MNKFMLQEFLTSIQQPETKHSSTDTVTKDRVVSFRAEPALFSLLESLTEEWSKAGVSDTVRTILSMYFLPVIYEHSWKELKPEKVAEKGTGLSFELSRLKRFYEETNSYLEFLQEAQTRSRNSLGYIEKTLSSIEEILSEVEQKLENAVIKNEEKPNENEPVS